MDDPYKYEVFFECPNLDTEHKKRIETYFQVRRRSGGGECEPLKNLKDNIYTIAFRNQKDQERVLERCEHVLELAGGPLVITVQRNLPSVDHSVFNSTSTPSAALTSDKALTTGNEQLSTPASSDPEHKLQVDSYLLRYLKECPRAAKELEAALSSLACFFDLQPEEGVALVRGSAQISLGCNGVKEWMDEVEKVFAEIKVRYLCHFECDPHKIKILLQFCSSNQANDNVRVYSQIGVAIVVGEHSQVMAMLGDVLDCVKGQGSRIRQNQATTRRLGEAKLCLLWEEIKHGLGRYTPEVKVTQGDSGQLVLEGSVGEVLKAGEWVSEKEKSVLQRVADASPHLLAFLRKIYGPSGMLGDLLGLDEQVQIDLGDTELRMFSQFSDKLNKTEKALKHVFKEVNIEIPDSTVPAELRVKLESKANEICQTRHKAAVRFGTRTIYLLGHTQGVEELNEEITQFILDQAIRQDIVALPLPDIAERLPDLLKMHGFDLSEVTIHPNASPSRPTVLLSGPSNQLPELRNKLGLLLDSLTQDTLPINQPGALRYFQSPPGREQIQTVSSSRKCIIQLQNGSHTRASQGTTTVASYCFDGGMQVLVCEGDITQVHADALVNAANEDLHHIGGVAAALSQAGGPEVDQESRALVRDIGKIQTGDVVMTTGGNLNCKKLLHAVGPVQGNVGGRERALVENTVQSALKLAEAMDFQSIAIPCISSGVFGVPLRVCSEAIGSAVWEFGRQRPNLSKVILIDNRKEVVGSICDALDRRLQRVDSGHSTAMAYRSQQGCSATAPEQGTVGEAAGNCVQVEIVQGLIETQQVDVLVAPMVGHDPCSTRVGLTLSNLFGPELAAGFHKAAPLISLPGQSILVRSLSSPLCGQVFFLNLIPWDDQLSVAAIQALRHSVRCILTSCENNGFRSVAIPVLGTGALLRFPHEKAAMALMEEIHAHEQSRTARTPLLVRIIIHPSDKESSKAFQSTQAALHLKGFINDHPKQTSFYRHVSSTQDRVRAKMGEVELTLVYGNIIHESAEVLVNTTDFTKNDTGVSKAILNAAGQSVKAQLSQAGTPTDYMCTTGPGALGCKEIIHAAFKCDVHWISKICGNILKQCESKGFKSVAFPAVNTGAGGMDADRACKAMLDGIATAVRLVNPKVLSHISIVMLQQFVFQAFRSELNNRLGETAPSLSFKEKAKHMFNQLQNKVSRSTQPAQSLSACPAPAVFRVVGCGPSAIEGVKRDLEAILEQQLIKREVEGKDVSKLDEMELDAVRAKARVLGVSLESKRGQTSGNTKGCMGTVSIDLRGLKEDVLMVKELIDKALHTAFQRDLVKNKEAMMAQVMQWSMKDMQGDWQELSLHANYLLEEALQNKCVFVKIEEYGIKLVVNMKKEEATDEQTGLTYRVKREQAETGALKLPIHWEPMAGEQFKKVELQPNSNEYKDIAKGFLNTANQSIIQKIERVQNIQLWQAYALLKKHMHNKNGDSHVRERMLYHGTSEKAAHCIEKIKFDRAYAGTHGAKYGKGVYFAVDAAYSVHFSPTDPIGLKRMYVARVLSGHYTVGDTSMMAPPPRSTSDPTDCYDSLVDNQQNPSMFVIFHDNQAYPEYLITFK